MNGRAVRSCYPGTKLMSDGNCRYNKKHFFQTVPIKFVYLKECEHELEMKIS